MRKEIDECLNGYALEGDTAVAEITFGKGFSGFKGHFPDQPILPGVCQIALAMAMAERMSGTRQSLVEVVNAKFVSMVQPDQCLRVECRLADGVLRAKLLLADGARVAEFKLRIEDA